MRQKRIFFKTISLLVAILFFYEQMVWASGEPAIIETDKTVSGSYNNALFINSLNNSPNLKNIARIENKYQSSEAEGNETIINIQDCHASLSAQYSIVNILKDLFQNYKVDVLGIEGGVGYIDTSILKTFPDEKIREKTADYLMKQGKISAGEFFSATTNEDIALYGVEDDELYQENLKMFRTIYEQNRGNLLFLSRVLKDLMKKETRIYSSELNSMIHKLRLHRDSKISFDIYWSFLEKLCFDKNIPTQDYLSVKSFTESISLEKNINFEKATFQRKELIDKIVAVSDKSGLAALVLKSLSFKRGEINEAAYHTWLMALAVKKKISAVNYKELLKYIDYVNKYHGLDVSGLQRELDIVEQKLLDELLLTKEQKELYKTIKFLEHIKMLFEIRLTNEDLAYVSGALAYITADEILRIFMGDGSARKMSRSELNNKNDNTALKSELNTILCNAKEALAFYDIAETRDRAMIKNTLRAMRSEGKKIAALISGGHHSSNLTGLMKQKGISYLVFAPDFSKDHPRPYVAVLTKKTGPYKELASDSSYYLALEAYFDTGNIDELEEMLVFAVGQSVINDKDYNADIQEWLKAYEAVYGKLFIKKLEAMHEEPIDPKELQDRLAGIRVIKKETGRCKLNVCGKTYLVTPETVELMDAGKEDSHVGKISVNIKTQYLNFLRKWDAMKIWSSHFKVPEKIAFLDWDGTVVRTADVTADAFVAVAGSIFKDEKTARKFFVENLDGLNMADEIVLLREYAQSHGRKFPFSDAVQYGNVLDNKKLELIGDDLFVVQGIETFIRHLKNNGFYVYVASGMSCGAIEIQAKKLGLFDLFDGIHGSPSTYDDPIMTKDEFITVTLKRHGISNAHAFMIGDAKRDMEAANKAGVFGIGRADKTEKIKELLETGASFTVRDYSRGEELLKAIDQDLAGNLFVRMVNNFFLRHCEEARGQRSNLGSRSAYFSVIARHEPSEWRGNLFDVFSAGVSLGLTSTLGAIALTWAAGSIKAFSSSSLRGTRRATRQSQIKNIYDIPLPELMASLNHGFFIPHVSRHMLICKRIAKALRLSEDKIKLLEYASALHDIGVSVRGKHEQEFFFMAQSLQSAFPEQKLSIKKAAEMLIQRQADKQKIDLSMADTTVKYGLFKNGMERILDKELSEVEQEIAYTMVDVFGNTLRILEDRNISISKDLEVLLKYHIDYKAFLRDLEKFEQELSFSKRDISLLLSIIFLADIFEHGNNKHTQMKQRNKERVETFPETFSFLEKEFNARAIKDKRAIDVLKVLLEKKDKELCDIVREARETPEFMSGDFDFDVDVKLYLSSDFDGMKALDDKKPDRDMKGPDADDTHPIIEKLIKNGRIAEVFLQDDDLVAYRVRWDEKYKAGVIQEENLLGEEIDIDAIFTKNQQENIKNWIRDHKLPKKRGYAHFRIALDNVALNWTGRIETSNIAHAGYSDACIYIGEGLMASLFDISDDPLCKIVLAEDEYRHLLDRQFKRKDDVMLYWDDLDQVADRIMGIVDAQNPPFRYDFFVCKTKDEALQHYNGLVYEKEYIRWGNFMPVDKVYRTKEAKPINVSAGIYLCVPFASQADPSKIKMKIWLRWKAEPYRWIEKRMELVQVKDLNGDLSFQFVGTLPLFFEGKYTFKYSIDRGNTWQWANYGAQDDREIIREKSVDEKAVFGKGIRSMRKPSYKKEQYIKLYQGDVNLSQELNLDISEGRKRTEKIIYKHNIYSAGESGGESKRKKEGTIVVKYNGLKHAVTVDLHNTRAWQKDDSVKRSFQKKQEWDKARIEIPLDEKGNAREVQHILTEMGISRMGIWLLLEHSGIKDRFPKLYDLMFQELVLHKVEDPEGLGEIGGSEVVAADSISSIQGDPEKADIADIEKVENIVEYSKSRMLRQLALEALKVLVNEGCYERDKYLMYLKSVREADILDGMSRVERRLRRDKLFVRNMDIDPDNVDNICIRWFVNGRHKVIYHVTFYMTDGSAEDREIRVIWPVSGDTIFDMALIKESTELWKEISAKEENHVPRIYTVREEYDYRPKILKAFMPELAGGRQGGFSISKDIVDPRKLIYDDVLIVGSEIARGNELVEYKASVAVNEEEKEQADIAAISAYLNMWKFGQDPETKKGPGLYDLKRDSMVVYRENTGYRGLIVEVDKLRRTIDLQDVINSLYMCGFNKENVISASEDSLLDSQESLYIAQNYDNPGGEKFSAAASTDTSFFMIRTEGLRQDRAEHIKSKILKRGKDVLIGEKEEIRSFRKIRAACSFLQRTINETQAIDVNRREQIVHRIGELVQATFWKNIGYYKIRDSQEPIFEMLCAFRKNGQYYFVEGFLNDMDLSKPENIAKLILKNILKELFRDEKAKSPPGNNQKNLEWQNIDEIEGKIWKGLDPLEKVIAEYAKKCHIRILMEDEVLGRDLVKYQRLKDPEEAKKNAREFIDTIYLILKEEGKHFEDEKQLIKYLTERFGLRVIVIGGGKGTRFSPDGLIVKPVFKPDQYNTQIKLSRISAAFGKLEDVVIIDTSTALRILKSGLEISDRIKERIQERICGEKGLIHRLTYNSRYIYEQEQAPIRKEVGDIIRAKMRYTRRSDGIRDLPMVVHLVSDAVYGVTGRGNARGQFLTDKISQIIFEAVLEEEEYIDQNRKDALLGKNCIVVLDSGEGHGSAYVEALEQLEEKGKLEEAAYSVIVHADSPGWMLDKYENYIFIGYLKTINRISPQRDTLPKITIAAKTPVDGRGKGRARIFVEQSPKYGQIATGLKEWNSMGEKEKQESEELASLQEKLYQDGELKSPAYLTNANIFIFNARWTYKKRGVLFKDYCHDLGKRGQQKRRLHEYWATDFVNIAAEEYKTRQTREQDPEPLLKLINIGTDPAPVATKTLQRTLDFRDELQEMILEKIRKLGVDIDDEATTVSISTFSEKGLDFDWDWDDIISNIFGDNLTKDEDYRHTRLRGHIHLEYTVRVKKGAFLDGKYRDVCLSGNCVVERGVKLQGVVAKDEIFEKDRLHDKTTRYLIPSETGCLERTKLVDINLADLGLITNKKTTIWLKKNQQESDEKVLMRIFGSDKNGKKCIDQIFLYGDIILEDTVRIENGTMLDGRSREIILSGKTHVGQHVNLKGVRAKNTIFAGRRDLNIYRYKQPATYDTKFSLYHSIFRNSYVEYRALVENSTVFDSIVSDGAKVKNSDIREEIVVCDEKVEDIHISEELDILNCTINPNKERRKTYAYVPGPYFLKERTSDDREDIERSLRSFAESIFDKYMGEEEWEVVRKDMQKDLNAIIPEPGKKLPCPGPNISKFTPQQIKRYIIAKVQAKVEKYKPDDLSVKTMDSLILGLRKYAVRKMPQAMRAGKLNKRQARTLFKRLALLAVRANFIDLSMDPKLFDVTSLESISNLNNEKIKQMLNRITRQELPEKFEKRFSAVENLVFGNKKGTFLYCPDNFGEAEIDALVWAFLISIGHRVVVAAKDGFSYSDIDYSGIKDIIQAHPVLQEHEKNGKIKVIKLGFSGEGLFLHKLSKEVQEILKDRSLMAVVLKGQANTLTTIARNKLTIPVIVMFLNKSMATQYMTDISRQKPFWPIIALVMPSQGLLKYPVDMLRRKKKLFQNKTVEAEDSQEKRMQFSVVVEELPKAIESKAQDVKVVLSKLTKDADKTKEHAFNVASAVKWQRTFFIACIFWGIASWLFFLITRDISFGKQMGALVLFFGLFMCGMRYGIMAKAVKDAFCNDMLRDRASNRLLKNDIEFLEKARSKDIAYRQSSGRVTYNPAFEYLPEKIKQLIYTHESFRSHFWGMLAVLPLLGVIIKKVRDIFRAEEAPNIYYDYSNLHEVLDNSIKANIASGFLKEKYINAEKEESVAPGVNMCKILDRTTGDPDIQKIRKTIKEERESGRCDLCSVSEWSNEVSRPETDDWTFSPRPAPVFASQFIAINSQHMPQDDVNPKYFYDVLTMLKGLKNWQITWPGKYGAKFTKHLHINLFKRGEKAPVELFEIQSVARDKNGEKIISEVINYPDRDHAIAAFVVEGSFDEPNLFAKRCNDLEEIVKKAGCEVDKFIIRDKSWGLRMYLYPRTCKHEKVFSNGQKRVIGPEEMSGIWRISDPGDYKKFCMGDVYEIFKKTTLKADSVSYKRLKNIIERHFSETEGKGILPPGMDFLVSEKYDRNCPVSWEANIPDHASANLETQKKMIDVMYENGMRRLVFTVGSKYSLAHLAELLKCAKRKGITTWLFANDIYMYERSDTDKIMPYVNMISLSLDGHDENTNSFTRQKWQFRNVMRMLDLIKKYYPEKEVQIRTIVTGQNKDDIWEIGKLLREQTLYLKNLQWKLNQYRRVGRSRVLEDIENDKYVIGYKDFKDIAITMKKNFSDNMKVRYSYDGQDKAYLYVLSNGSLATIEEDQYKELGNILDPGTLKTRKNLCIFEQVTENMMKKTIFIPRRSIYNMPDFRKKRIMSPEGDKIIKELLKNMSSRTQKHSNRVEAIARLIVAKLKDQGCEFKKYDLLLLKRAIQLHDLGAEQKLAPHLKKAKHRMDIGIKNAPGGSVEPTEIGIYDWASAKVLIDKNVPYIEDVRITMDKARETGDYYPLYRMYIKYIVLKRNLKEDLSDEEEIVVKNIFNHGRDSIEFLRKNNIEVSLEMELLIRFHHDYNVFERRLKEGISAGKISRERESMLCLLMTVLIVSDAFETGNNYERIVKERKKNRVEDFIETFEEFGGFIWKRFHRSERIREKRALDALKDLLAEEVEIPDAGKIIRIHPELARILKQVRACSGLELLTERDRKFQERIVKARKSITKKSHNVKVIVGLPENIYDKLRDQAKKQSGEIDDIERLKDIAGVENILRIKGSVDRFEQFEGMTAGLACLFFCIDESVEFNGGNLYSEVAEIITDFIEKAEKNIIPVLQSKKQNRLHGAFTVEELDTHERKIEELQDKIDSIDSSNEVVAGVDTSEIVEVLEEINEEVAKLLEDLAVNSDIIARILPQGRSYSLSEKSLYQIKIEKAFSIFHSETDSKVGHVEYLKRAVDNRKTHYLVHFADGANIYLKDGSTIIPPGLEIEKRRRQQGLTVSSDPNKDKFFIVAPEKNMTREEKDTFKRMLMDIWMLDRIVSEDDVVILDRAQYETGDIYTKLSNACEGVDPLNTGFRCINGSLKYSTIASKYNLLQINMSPEAMSNVNQYEIFFNLLISREQGDMEYLVPGLEEKPSGLFVYKPKTRAFDLESNIRRYYERYLREVMIKA
ncbi:MAG: HAD family hydrolase [Candidatus Omnitrophota bacterium]